MIIVPKSLVLNEKQLLDAFDEYMSSVRQHREDTKENPCNIMMEQAFLCQIRRLAKAGVLYIEQHGKEKTSHL